MQAPPAETKLRDSSKNEFSMMNRYQFFNTLIERNGYKSYLEIGVHTGECFMAVQCRLKVGVDPSPLVKLDEINECTSDEFFCNLPADRRFDLIFIDGLHTAEQVERDIVNSLRHLSRDGMICLHDINPPTEESQRVPKVSTPWKGTVWRAFVGFRQQYPWIESYTLAQCDTGIGVILGCRNEVVPGFSTTMNYETFDRNRTGLLGIAD
jgi:predicted O-methyltransferase YrrM